MQTYELTVKGRSVHANSADTTLVRTSIGIDKIHVLFDNDEWLDFALSVTFAQGSGSSEQKVTTSITPQVLSNSQWVAEAECVIPWEVINMVGPIRVTFQGFDTNGNHIITAAGSPLSVEEAGDVVDGDDPQATPTIDQWSQAYADAAAAASAALSAAAAAEDAIEDMRTATRPAATTSSLGEVKPDGTTITVEQDGTIHGAQSYTLPIATGSRLGGVMVDGESIEASQLGTLSLADDLASALSNLRILASIAFDTEFDGNGTLESAVVKSGNLPPATSSDLGGVYPDGTTVSVTDDGMLSALPKTTWRGTCSTDDSIDVKTVTCEGFTLSTGAIVSVTFTSPATTAKAISLKVGPTDTKTIYVNNSATSSSNPLTWSAHETLTFMYDGTRYLLIARDVSSQGTGSGSTWYATCSTTYSTAAKVASCSNFSLSTGAIVSVAFSADNTADAPTLNVNSTGAKSIYVNGSVTSSSNQLLWNAGDVLTFIYDGTQYHLIARSSVQESSQGSGGGAIWHGTSSTANSTATKAVTCSDFTLQDGAMIAVTFSNAGDGSSTVQLNVNSTGDKYVMVNGTANGLNGKNKLVWSAGDTLVFLYDGTSYHLVAPSVPRAATSGTLGGVMPDSSTTSVTSAGTISARTAWRASCSTAASTTAKEISTAPTGFTLKDGVILSVRFTYKNAEADEITLNVGSNGAKFIYVDGQNTSSYNPLYWEAGDTLTFMYDSTSQVFHFLAKTGACKVDNSTIKVNQYGEIYVDAAAVKAAIEAL